MYSKALVLFLISMNAFNISHQLYGIPNVTNPLIPKRWRERCGYRYRPYEQKITYLSKCFANTYKNVSAIGGHPEFEPRRTLSRLVGGRKAEYREAPWVVQLVRRAYNNETERMEWKNVCSGTLITMRHIITNAHCLKRKEIYIFYGSEKRFGGYDTNELELFQHPIYVSSNDPSIWSNYDLGMVVLNKSLNWRTIERKIKTAFINTEKSPKHWYVNTICLPQRRDPDWLKGNNRMGWRDRYEPAAFYSWGLAENDTRPDSMQRADLRVRYYDLIDRLDLKYRSLTNGSRTCAGDSGSGLFQYLDEYENRAVMIGVVNGFNTAPGTPPGSPCSYDTRWETTAIRVQRHLEWIDNFLRDYPDTDDGDVD